MNTELFSTENGNNHLKGYGNFGRNLFLQSKPPVEQVVFSPYKSLLLVVTFLRMFKQVWQPHADYRLPPLVGIFLLAPFTAPHTRVHKFFQTHLVIHDVFL